MSALLSHRGLLLGAGAWSPYNISPQIWLDDSTTVTNVSGNASAWFNKGSVGGSYTQVTAGSRPLIVASGLNGRRTLRFDGTNDYLIDTSSAGRGIFSTVTKGWLFAVVKRAASTSKICAILQSRTTSPVVSRFACYSGSNVASYFTSGALVARRLDADSAGVLRDPASFGTNWAALYFEQDWATGTGRIITNGGSPVSAALTSAGSTASGLSDTGVYLGSEGTTTFSDNEVAAVISGGGSSLPSSGDISNLFTWASNRYGV